MPTGVESGVGPDLARHADATAQWAFTVGNWTLAVAAIVVAVVLSRRMDTWTPLVIVAVGGCLGTFVEPLFDSYYHLWFYSVDQWTFFEAHGISQPVWVLPTYLWFYGGQALFVYKLVVDGAGRREVMRVAGAIFVIATAFELIGINLGVYEYWGPQALQISGFPLWISVDNAAIPVVTGLIVARLEPHAPGPQQLMLGFVMPAVAMAFWYVTSFPVIDLMNTADPSERLLDVAAVASMVLGGLATRIAIKGLIAERFPSSVRPVREHEARARQFA